MLYYLVRPLARLALKFWFRKIYRTHLDRVPRDKPVIFAVNHPTIFIEPCLLACYQPRALFFLTKGVLFKSPFVTVLKSLQMVPIYRKQDGGFGKRKSNVDTFDYCYQLFDQQGCTMIMPEGSSAQVKYLRPLTKGFARLAFGYYEESGNADIYIQPVGINYSDADAFRSEVAIGFGKPLHLERYIANYIKNPRIATQQLVEDLFQAMKTQVVHVPEEDLVLAEQLWLLYRNDLQRTVFPIVEEKEPLLKNEKAIGEKISLLPPDKKQALTIETNQYFKQLEKLGIKDQAIVSSEKGQLAYLLLFIIGFIPALFGFITNILPYLIGQGAGKLTNDVETRMSVVLGISFGAYLIYFASLLCYTICNATWVAISLVLLIPICGYLSLVYWEKWQEWLAIHAVSRVEAGEMLNLKTRRSLLVKQLTKLKKK